MARVNEIDNAFEDILPPPKRVRYEEGASASSSTPTKKAPYDVFINHRGPDTKQTLAASIYRTLKSMGLRVFLDEAELELGDSIPSEIQDAMTTSFLHVAILSPRYAQSTWCLTELSFMLKTGKKVIPVFYNVDPSHIHWICTGKGVYAKAFSEHEAKARYASETLEDWKIALQKVSYFEGSIVQNEHDKEMLKNIVNYVLEHRENIPLVVAKHPVGLDETLQDFERSALESFENVKIVGIVGMGGCGKTTLAKEYYNKKRFSIYRCSFVCNVRDTLAKDFHKKQKKMFQDLGGSKDKSFDNVEKGKAILAEHLKSVQVFIILDDVDHLDQLDSLLPIKGNLQEGSVVVVTSRDFGILTSWGISSNSIYRMKELKVEHAMELFCWHAFLQPSPVDEFEYLIKKFLKTCKGLPLSLKVLGGLVHGKSKKYWDSQLNKVSRLLPEDIKNVLKVSFDALDEEDREIFLDISCFFIGTKANLAITLWDGSGWSGMCSLVTLVNKCLVEIDGGNCIRMHDQLRDSGKEIAKTWSPYRLWSPQQINHIEAQPGQGRVLIRGIKADTDEFYEECMELVRGPGRRFKRCLEILDVENNYFTEELATLSAGLVWLRWVNFPHTALQSWIPLKKLRYLELHEANKLEQLWSETADPPVQLRELKIIGARSLLRFPRSIGYLKHLKEITLDSNGAPIEGLPEEFCRLQSLEYLKLSGCHQLKSLPGNFGDLTNMRSLYLGECSAIEGLPEEFCRLQSLEYLELTECHNLKSLPSKFGDLTNLQRLYLNKCSGLMMLPSSFKQLMHLQYIFFHYCSNLTFPSETLVQLPSLNHLQIHKCPGLTELVIPSGCVSSSLCSLEYISLSSCHMSRISISQQCCPRLETLSLDNNHHLVEIDSLPTSVKSIYLDKCSNLKSISRNCGLVELKKLVITECGELQNIEGLENCRSLEILEVRTWGKVPVIQSLRHMESLWRLELTAACHISAFEPWLQTINIKKWPSECIICARTVPGVEAIVKSFTFPGLTLVQSCPRKKCGIVGSVYTFLQGRSSTEAAMLCFIINCTSSTTVVNLYRGFYKSFLWNSFPTTVKEGKWVWIGVFTKSSPVGRRGTFQLEISPSLDDVDTVGKLMIGEEKSIVDAFYELSQHLGKVGDIYESQ